MLQFAIAVISWPRQFACVAKGGALEISCCAILERDAQDLLPVLPAQSFLEHISDPPNHTSLAGTWEALHQAKQWFFPQVCRLLIVFVRADLLKYTLCHTPEQPQLPVRWWFLLCSDSAEQLIDSFAVILDREMCIWSRPFVKGSEPLVLQADTGDCCFECLLCIG